MPSVNKNEKRLLFILGGAVFLVANAFGFVFLSSAMGGITREKERLNVRLRGLEEARSKSAEAETKGAWIDEHLLAYATEADREVYLNNKITDEMVNGLDLELSKNAPAPTIEGAYFVKSRYKATVKGPWVDVLTFLWRVQDPKYFHFVPRLSMVPKKNEQDDSVPLVEVTLEIEKWWPKPDGFTTEQPAAAENVEQPAPAPVETPAGEAASGNPPSSSPEPPPASSPSSPPAVPSPVPASETESPKPNP